MSGRFEPTRVQLLLMAHGNGNRGQPRLRLLRQETHRADPVHEGQERSHDAFLHLVLSPLALRTQSVQLIDEDDRRLSDQLGEKRQKANP